MPIRTRGGRVTWLSAHTPSLPPPFPARETEKSLHVESPPAGNRFLALPRPPLALRAAVRRSRWTGYLPNSTWTFYSFPQQLSRERGTALLLSPPPQLGFFVVVGAAIFALKITPQLAPPLPSTRPVSPLCCGQLGRLGWMREEEEGGGGKRNSAFPPSPIAPYKRGEQQRDGGWGKWGWAAATHQGH